MKLVVWTLSIAFAIFGVIALVLVPYTQTYKGCAADRAREHETGVVKESPAIVVMCYAATIDANDRLVTALGTVVIALFTLVLGVATVYLWLGGEKQLALSRGTAQRQLRAYVGPMGREITDFYSDGPARATVEIKNFGQTPAYDVTAVCNIVVNVFPVPGGIIFNYEPALFSTRKFVLHPSEHIEIVGTRLGNESPSLTDAERPEVFTGSKAIYVFGKVVYKDAFGEDHETEWLYYKGGDVGAEGTRLAIYNMGNRAT